MKKTYIIIIVLVLIVLGVLFFTGRGSKLEAPTVINDINKENEKTESTSPVSNTMPILGADSEVKEMVVVGVKEFTVSGQNFSFIPNSITVKKGDKVKITFKNIEGFHNLAIDEFNVVTKTIKNGEEESVEFIADKVGSFEYYCSVGTHRAMGMWGTLKVE